MFSITFNPLTIILTLMASAPLRAKFHAFRAVLGWFGGDIRGLSAFANRLARDKETQLTEEVYWQWAVWIALTLATVHGFADSFITALDIVLIFSLLVIASSVFKFYNLVSESEKLTKAGHAKLMIAVFCWLILLGLFELAKLIRLKRLIFLLAGMFDFHVPGPSSESVDKGKYRSMGRKAIELGYVFLFLAVMPVVLIVILGEIYLFLNEDSYMLVRLPFLR